MTTRDPTPAAERDAGPSPQAEQRYALFEDCAEAIDALFREALQSRPSEAVDEFLGFMARFNGLSAYNAMLVRIQKPGATAVGSRRQWAGVGRRIKPGAVPLVILQAFGPVRFVYELLDTEGQAIDGEQMNAFLARGHLRRGVYESARAAARRFGVEAVETTQFGAARAGVATTLGQPLPQVVPRPGGKPSRADTSYRVLLNAHHDEPTRFATLAHELGHIYCGHLGADPFGRWPSRRGLSDAERELEAEAVSWLVSRRCGLTTNSPEYLSDIVQPDSMSNISMYAIFEAANRVEARTVLSGGTDAPAGPLAPPQPPVGMIGALF